MGADSIEHVAEVVSGSISKFLHVVHKLISTAAVSPPLSLPANNQFLRPSAMGLNVRLVLAVVQLEKPSLQGALQCRPMVQGDGNGVAISFASINFT